MKKYTIWGNGSAQLNGTKLTKGQQVRVDLYNTTIEEVAELKGLTYKEFTQGHTEKTEDGTYIRMYIEVTGSLKDYKAKLEFSTNKVDEYLKETCIFHHDDKRSLDAWVTVTGCNGEVANDVLYRVIEIMERELNEGQVFSRCPSGDEIDDNKFEAIDTMTVDYIHGWMTDTKKNIKEAFKTAKKELGIR